MTEEFFQRIWEEEKVETRKYAYELKQTSRGSNTYFIFWYPKNQDHLRKTLFYFEVYENKLQLHDHQTFWKLYNDSIPQFNEDIICLMDNKIFEYCDLFKEKTGEEIILLGRSSRHVCVDFNLKNVKRYRVLQAWATKLEEEFVDWFNNEDFAK